MASKYLFIILVALPMMILANEAIQPIVKMDSSSLNHNNYYNSETWTYFSNCPAIKGCTFETDDCTSFKCTHQVLGERFIFAMKMDVCGKDAKVTITISYSSYTKTITVFNGKKDVPLVGFSSAADLYLRTEVTRGSGENIHLKLSLGFKILSFGKSVKILDHKFDNTEVSIDKCGFLKWLSAQETGVQAGIYGGFALVVLSIIACIGCCCCCYKRRKSPGVIVAAGQGGPNVQMETRTELPTNIGTEYVKF